MFKFAASLAVASAVLAAPGISSAAEIARPLHARLIAPPTLAAFADASRMIVRTPSANRPIRSAAIDQPVLLPTSVSSHSQAR